MGKDTITGKRLSALIPILADAVEMEGSQRRWAEKHGFNQADVSKVLNEKIPMPTTMANALGYITHVVCVPLRKTNR